MSNISITTPPYKLLTPVRTDAAIYYDAEVGWIATEGDLTIYLGQGLYFNGFSFFVSGTLTNPFLQFTNTNVSPAKQSIIPMCSKWYNVLNYNANLEPVGDEIVKFRVWNDGFIEFRGLVRVTGPIENLDDLFTLPPEFTSIFTIDQAFAFAVLPLLDGVITQGIQRPVLKSITVNDIVRFRCNIRLSSTSPQFAIISFDNVRYPYKRVDFIP